MALEMAIQRQLASIFASLIFAATCFELARAAECPLPSSEIETDRPDVTNSGIVVPAGSFQSENGINVSQHEGATIFDGTSSRVRFGVAPCFEFLIDLPNYFAALDRQKAPSNSSLPAAPRIPVGGQPVRLATGWDGAASGFSDVIPAVKWQVSPEPGKFDMSITAGLGLPTGAKRIAGEGFQPYLQLPWSRELENGWVLNGMFTEFFHPSDSPSTSISEVTLSIEKKLTEKTSVLMEYAGDYPDRSAPSQMLNWGILHRFTRTQQLDMHLAVGLNHNTPDYIVGVGYSFRLDGLF
jgi:hypothetical protein